MGYFDLQPLPGGGFTKPGVRGFPGVEPAQDLLLRTVEVPDGARSALDLSARGGALAAHLAAQGLAVMASDTSSAALTALRAAAEVSGFAALAGAPSAGRFDLVSLVLPAERGNAAVQESLRSAAALAAPGASVYLAGEKERGFERYFKSALALIGPGEVVERERGRRVARIDATGSEPAAPVTAEYFPVEARGKELRGATLPGVFAGAKLDAATRLLLQHLPSAQGRRVLDLGCGNGVIGAMLASEGGLVTLVDDDLASVAAARATLASNELDGRVLHSDVDAAIPEGESFDLVVSNPPFHVGANLILDVALEFVAAAGRRLAPGGEAWLVANHFLPYERPLAVVGAVEEVARADGFKVLRAGR